VFGGWVVGVEAEESEGWGPGSYVLSLSRLQLFKNYLDTVFFTATCAKNYLTPRSKAWYKDSNMT
jgi:hypothetical protein